MSNLTVPQGYFSEEEMASQLGKTISTLRGYHCRRNDKLVPPKTKIGGRIIYNIESFQRWLQTKEIEPYKFSRSRRGAK
jgi:hypothetical protein